MARGGDETGQVTGGWLRLRSRLAKLEDDQLAQLVFDVRLEDNPSGIKRWRGDKMVVYCVPIVEAQAIDGVMSFPAGVSGLMLIPTGKERGQYVRCGYFSRGRVDGRFMKHFRAFPNRPDAHHWEYEIRHGVGYSGVPEYTISIV